MGAGDGAGPEPGFAGRIGQPEQTADHDRFVALAHGPAFAGPHRSARGMPQDIARRAHDGRQVEQIGRTVLLERH